MFFKANQSDAHALACDSLCYVSNVSNETTIQLSPDICESDLAKATNEAFFFHSKMNYNKQFVISNQPRKEVDTSWVGFIVGIFAAYLPKNLCLLMKIIIYWISIVRLSFPSWQ